MCAPNLACWYSYIYVHTYGTVCSRYEVTFPYGLSCGGGYLKLLLDNVNLVRDRDRDRDTCATVKPKMLRPLHLHTYILK